MRDRRPAQPDAITKPPPSPLFTGALCILIILVATFLAHGQGLRNGFVNWDDDYVLVDNDSFRGLSLDHLRWMFTTSHAGHYQPLTWLSYAFDFSVWGEVSAFGMHLTNLILHALTAIAFWLVAKTLFQQAIPAANGRNVLIGATGAALLFAVHPLRVESVAWATERRDVLSGVWLLLTIYAYLRAVTATTSRGTAWMAVSLTCYVLSLLSKAVGMTVPLVLLLIDIFPLHRWPHRDSPGRRKVMSSLWIEKLPFAVPAALFAFLAAWAQRDAGAMWDVSAHPAALRVAQAFHGIMFYLLKTLWPVGLIPLYEQPTDAQPFDPTNLVAMAAVFSASFLLWWKRRYIPAPATCWFAYLVMVSPMLGLAQSGPQVVADRYSYIACLPFALLAGGAVVRNRMELEKWKKFVAGSAATAMILALILLSQRQTAVWADSHALWTHTLSVAPRTGVAHANLASVLNKRQDFAAALAHGQTALEILPGNRVAHLTLARAALGLGDLAIAEKHYEIGLTIRRDDPGAMIFLAGIKLDLGKVDDAELLCRRLVEIEPTSAQWPVMLATVLSRAGKDPEATSLLLHALSLDPNHADARLRAAALLMRAGESQAALTLIEEGVRRLPDDAQLRARLSWLLATSTDERLRDGPRALDLARQALAADPLYPASHEALAAAQAETGDLTAAIATLEKAMTTLENSLGSSLRTRWMNHLSSLRSGSPLRD